MPKTPLLPKRHCSAFYHLVHRKEPKAGTSISRERKPLEDVTEKDREFHQQQSRDWMMWSFIIGMDTVWLAENLLCEREDVRREIDAVCSYEHPYNHHPFPLLAMTPWNSNQDLLLRKCKKAQRSLDATADLLSRTPDEVRQRSRELQQGKSNG
jgi:hypothetical protein